MTQQLIFIGDMKAEPFYIVSRKHTATRYHKIGGQLIEYQKIPTYERLEEIHDLSHAVLCVQQEDQAKRQLKEASSQGVVFIPKMNEWELDVLFSMLHNIKRKKNMGTWLGIAGKAVTLGRMTMDLLEKFGRMQNHLAYHLVLGVPSEVGIRELAAIEDVIQEYMIENGTLRIEQRIIEEAEEYHYILF